jgi:hypothetical protein
MAVRGERSSHPGACGLHHRDTPSGRLPGHRSGTLVVVDERVDETTQESPRPDLQYSVLGRLVVVVDAR